jgi:hypothetical protein
MVKLNADQQKLEDFINTKYKKLFDKYGVRYRLKPIEEL